MMNFIHMCKNQYASILAFEPDEENYSDWKMRIDSLKDERIKLFNRGL